MVPVAKILPLVEFTVTVALDNFLIAPYSFIVTVPFIIGSPFETVFLTFEFVCNVESVELLL